MSYTERERVRYVERMWAEGLTPAEAGRRWGRPARATLRSWELAAERGELPAERPRVNGACPHEKHARWPEATKTEAVRRVLAGERPANVARSMGIPGGRTVSGWAAAERARMSPPGAEGAPKAGKAASGKLGARERERLAELERRNAELEEQVAVLRELMRDPKAGDPASLSNRRKAELGERLRRGLGLSLRSVLLYLNISKSTYEYNRARLEGAGGAEARDAADDAAVLASFEASGGTYGYRRVAADTGLPQRRVRASMRRQGLEARDSRRCKRWSSYAGEVSDAPPNLLMGGRGHDFSAPAPNARWVTDITEMRAGARKLYFSVVVDLFDGRAVAWGCSESPNAELANSTLEAAVATLAPGEAPLVHSDRGCHYRWPGWVAICERAGLTRSMSRKGHSPDNAACEAFFGRMKVEMYHGADWSLASVQDLAAALDRYARWYNSGRLKSFREPGMRTRARYETIDGRRRRLGLRV